MKVKQEELVLKNRFYNSNKIIQSPNIKKIRIKIVHVIDDFDKNAICQKVHMF